MADDVTLPGAGVVVATDDVGSGRQVQLIKPVFGVDGSATMVSADAPLPVQDLPLIATATATATGIAVASVDLQGYHSVVLVLNGTFTASMNLQLSPDGTTWANATATQINFGGANPLPADGGNNSTLSAAGANYFQLNSSPYRYARVNVASYTSGSVGITLRATRAPGPLTSVNIAASKTLSVTPASGTTPSDGFSNSSQWAQVGAFGYGFNGSTWNRARYATMFKSANAVNSGDTAIWTPTSGKRFQLLGFQLYLSEQAAKGSAGNLTMALRDATTAIGIEYLVYVSATNGTSDPGAWSTGWVNLGAYGYRSLAVNNVLNLNLSAALTAGVAGIVVSGVEE